MWTVIFFCFWIVRKTRYRYQPKVSVMYKNDEKKAQKIAGNVSGAGKDGVHAGNGVTGPVFWSIPDDYTPRVVIVPHPRVGGKKVAQQKREAKKGERTKALIVCSGTGTGNEGGAEEKLRSSGLVRGAVSAWL